MALSAADKREIADMLETFSERMTTGRQVKSAEEQVLDAILARALAPMSPLRGGPRYAPLEERVVGEVIETAILPKKRKKRMTQFNRAVKLGMAAAKKSKFYGKKGTLTSPKRAFAAVTKIASKLSRGKAVRRTGSSGVIARAMPKWGTGPRSGR
jgi:hypothetical protein